MNPAFYTDAIASKALALRLLGGAILVVASLLLLLHYRDESFYLLLFSVACMLGSWVYLLLQKRRYNLIMHLRNAAALALAARALFVSHHLRFGHVVNIVGIVILVAWIGSVAWTYSDKSVPSLFSSGKLLLLLLFYLPGTVIGSLFKIMHWPGATMFLTFSSLLTAALLLVWSLLAMQNKFVS